MPNLVKEYKSIFLGKWVKPRKSPKSFSVDWSFLWLCFEICQKFKSNLLSEWIVVQVFTMLILVNKYKTISLRKAGKPWKSWNFSAYIGVSYKFVWKSAKSIKSNLVSDWILVQGFIMSNLVDEYKNTFLGKQGKP